jgi:23S rRNA (uracil1939-C5)-methyltransferase
MKWQPTKGSRRSRQQPRLEVGATVVVGIVDLNSHGEGVARHHGEVIFVPGVWHGEHAQIVITGRQKSYAQGRVEVLVQAHQDRREPPCGVHGFDSVHCGGCAWLFMAYSAQLEAKQARVQALCDHRHWPSAKPIQPSDQELGYRNRAQFKATSSALGFVAASSDAVVDVTHCPVLSDHNNELLHQIRQQDLAIGKRRKRWLTIDIEDGLALEQVSYNQRLPFRQGNTAQNEWMQAWLRQHVHSLPLGLATLELFAGSGNFTHELVAAGVGPLVAAEVSAEALVELAASLPEVTALELDLIGGLSGKQIAEALPNAKLLVLDPPREGFAGLSTLVDSLSHLQWIVYISCDLASFQRDVEGLDSRFELIELQPIDLYPQTPHVEVLSFWSRRAR